MKDFVVFLVNSSGVPYPNTTALDATGPSATDGTEYVKAWCDEIMGITQAVLDRAGLTPSGVSEAAGAGNSQFIEALQLMGPGPGVITEWANALDPAVSGHRAILLQGQGVLRASFPDLDAAVYVGDGNNAARAAAGGAFYRADDAAGTIPNIVGIYLILPESRGVVPRGLDLAATIDPDGASRALGDLQADQFQGHIHYNGVAQANASVLSIYGTTTNDLPGSATQVGQQVAAARDKQALVSVPKDDATNGTPRTGLETRSHNRSTHFAIWY